MITAPFGMRKGLFSLFVSFKSLNLIAFFTSLRVIVLFIFLNSLNLRLAATFIEHLKKILYLLWEIESQCLCPQLLQAFFLQIHSDKFLKTF